VEPKVSKTGWRKFEESVVRPMFKKKEINVILIFISN
jgi:hypothetical protein